MRSARILVLVTAAWLASCSTPPERPTPSPPAPAPEPPPAPAVVINPGGITFAAVGDMMLGTDYPENVLPDDDGVSFLASVTPVLSAADIAFGNLEGVLMDGGEAVKRCRPVRATKASTTKTPARGAQTATTQPSVAAPPVPQAAPPSEPPSPSQPAPAAQTFDVEKSDANIAAVPVEEADASATAPTAQAAQSPADTAQSTQTPAQSAQAVASSAEAPAVGTQQPVATASTTLPSATEDTSTNPAPAGGSCYVFRSPTRYAEHLRTAGFDVMSLANNHAQDFGDPGRDSSMRALDGVGIRHSGRDGDIAEWTARGRRFALVAFAPNVGSHQLNDLVRAQEIVTGLAAKNDIVIVSFHGGAEGDGASKLPFARELYAGEDRGNVVEFARTVIDSGADLVIGHGPHVMRPIELYRDRLIAYSLGNFATYYGISVNGIRGTSGVLTTRLADDGRFMDARFTPTVQIRPGGPQPDPQKRATLQLRELTTQAFPSGGLEIAEDGAVSRVAAP